MSAAEAAPARRASRREILAWCLYDFADSSFTTIIVTVAYSSYFRTVVAAEAGERATFYWGLCIAASMILVAFTSPVLGAVADAAGRKKLFLAIYAGTAIAFTALLSTVHAGDIVTGMLFFIIANVGYEGAHIFYNGFLPEIASDEEVGRVSGLGWGIGYLGGFAALALTTPLIRSADAPGGDGGYRATFLVVALFYLVFALPILRLRERAPRGSKPLLAYARAGLRRLSDTFRHVRTLRDLFRFLLAFVVYNDAMTTVIAFSAIYARQELGFTMTQVYALFLVTQWTALAGSLAAGVLVDRWGARPTITATLVLWCAVVVAAFLARSVPSFFAVAIAASIGMGSTQCASRSLMALLIPEGRSAEYFGFYGFTGKISAVAGPLVYGLVADLTGGQRPAILSILPFFLVGLLLLSGVDVARGRRAAGGGAAAP